MRRTDAAPVVDGLVGSSVNQPALRQLLCRPKENGHGICIPWPFKIERVI
jgi:hypothetical protein